MPHQQQSANKRNRQQARRTGANPLKPQQKRTRQTNHKHLDTLSSPQPTGAGRSHPARPHTHQQRPTTEPLAATTGALRKRRNGYDPAPAEQATPTRQGHTSGTDNAHNAPAQTRPSDKTHKASNKRQEHRRTGRDSPNADTAGPKRTAQTQGNQQETPQGTGHAGAKQTEAEH